MAKATGLDPGDFEIKAVELEGSYRRPRLVRYFSRRRTEADGEPSSAFARVKAERYLGDDMTLGFPCREAVLRTLNVPFVGQDNIRKVIKFEAEGSIHSHNMDDMVVDFHVLEAKKSETKVLVAAVPKPALRHTIGEIEAQGIEPITVDLDTMALFRAADFCGAFSEELAAAPSAAQQETQQETEKPAHEALVVAAASTTRLVVDVGMRATRILVVVDGKLHDMRTLRTGVQSVAEDVAARAEMPIDLVHESLVPALESGEDYLVVLDTEEDAEDEITPEITDADTDEGEALSSAPEQVPHETIAGARDRFLARLRGELLRFLSGLSGIGRIQVVWMTGGGSLLPGVEELFGEVFACPLRRLDILGHVSHRLDEDEAARLSPSLAVAIGLALGRLGGPPGFNLRQEELAYTRGFDRLKFPLALACMLGLFLLVINDLKSFRTLRRMKQEFGATAVVTQKKTGRRGRSATSAKFHGYLGYLMNRPGGWFAQSRNFEPKKYSGLVKKLLTTPVFQRMQVVKNTMVADFRKLQESVGYYPELRIGSGYGVLVETARILDGLGERLGRFLVTEMELRMPPGDRGRYLRFVVVLRSSEGTPFRVRFAALKDAFEQAAKSPGSAFAALDKGNPEKRVFQGSENDEGAFYEIKMVLKPEKSFPVYPKTAGVAAVGGGR